MKKLFFVSLILVLLPIPAALALSDSEYRALIKASPQYRAAEAQLEKSWKRAMKSVKKVEGMAWRELRDDQRAWIAGGRDAEAQARMNSGLKRDEAYTRVTRDRAAYLESFVK